MAADPLIIGSRGSALALWQARYVARLLEAAGHRVHIVEIKTKGDRILNVPLAEIGDKGLFTKELDVALMEGRIHLAVHSLKDLPTRLPEGLVLSAVTSRESPWDVFANHPSFRGGLEYLPQGAVLGTSSLRRQAQLRAWRSDLEIVPVRGNIETRLAKLDASNWHGLILAEVGLRRLNLDHRIGKRIPKSIMLPAVSQGALGVVSAEGDAELQSMLKDALEDSPTRAAVTSERAFLRRLEGGCQVPIGAYAHIQNGTLTVEGCVGSLDGSRIVRGLREGDAAQAELLGKTLAEELLNRGADKILEEIRSEYNS